MQQMVPGINISTFRNMCGVREEHMLPGLYLEKHVVLVTCCQRVSCDRPLTSHTRETTMINAAKYI